MIDRFTRVKDSSEIIEWVRTVKQKVPALSVFMEYAAATSIRFVEGVNSYNLITGLSRKHSLQEYYDLGRRLLEHCKYKDLRLTSTEP